MRAIGNGIGIPFRRNTGQGVIWPPDLKSALVCWYSPRKQKLTEYDVIESYVEDFTVWGKNTERYTGSITNKTINITEVSKANSICVYTLPKKQNIKLYITGLVTGQNIILGNADVSSAVGNIIVSENGLYDIDESQFNRYFGIGFGFTGSCNITITQLPTSILKDFSENGLDAYMYGFQGKLNSGMGVYQTDFSSWNYYPSLSTVEYSPKGLVIKKVNSTAQFCASDFVGKFTAEVSGIPEGVSFYYRYIDKTTGKAVSITLSNGINEVDCSNANGDADMTNMFLIGANNKDINITITQIPDYPNQLCYSGKEYCISYNQPILTDYTVITDRTWFDNMIRACFLSKTIEVGVGAFIFEIFGSSSNFDTYSYGKGNTTKSFETGITYQTKNSYNGNSILSGNFNDSDVLTIGRIRPTEKNCYIGCHSDLLLFNRTLTQEEIDWVKNKIFKI